MSIRRSVILLLSTVVPCIGSAALAQDVDMYDLSQQVYDYLHSTYGRHMWDDQAAC